MKQRTAGNQIRVRLVSADVWGSLRLLNDRGIEVFRLHREDDLTIHFSVRRRDYPLLCALLEKRGDRVCVQMRSWRFYLEQSVLKRPLLYAGLALLFACSLMLPTRILGVWVEGNSTVPTRQILEAAQQSGIRLFVPCAEVRSEKMKNTLLSAIPELQWAGVNTYGCRAVISVRERTLPERKPEPEKTVGSIVAARDGIVESVTALQGTVLCRPGQAVKRGQVLISGYTDCGIYIRATQAKGEVYAETLRTVKTITPAFRSVRRETGGQKRALSLILGKKRIKLWKDSGISGGTCGRIEEEYPLTLPGGFLLPVCLVCETFTVGQIEEIAVEQQEAQEALRDYSQKYIWSQMLAGSVSYSEEILETPPGAYLMTRQLICTEMIGRLHLENGDSQ